MHNLPRRKQVGYKIRHYFRLLIPCFFLFGVTEAAFTLGPIQLRPGRFAYSWQASVDAPTGIATSKEVTPAASSRSSLVRHLQTNNEKWTDGVLDRLDQYPQWLVRGAVTFGLFHAVPVSEGGYSLQDRFFGIDFLTFGTPERLSVLEPQRVGGCTVTLPIRGGLLALCKNNNKKKMGCLQFTVQHRGEATQVVTEIQGYSPFLVGSREPVPFYRKGLYLSTQSLVHAYVMWRFHRHCIHTSYSSNSGGSTL